MFGVPKAERERLFSAEGFSCMDSLSPEAKQAFIKLCSNPEFKEIELIKPLIERLL